MTQVLCGAHDSSEKGQYSGYLRTQSACEKVSTLVRTMVSVEYSSTLVCTVGIF